MLTHHPTECRILSTIYKIIETPSLSVTLSFIDLSENILYVFVLYKENDIHKVDRYIKTATTSDHNYSKVLFYRDKNYKKFIEKTERFFSLFVCTLHNSLLYDSQIIKTILYHRKQYPLLVDMDVVQELIAYYGPYMKKDLSYPKYNSTHRVTKISLISFLSDDVMTIPRNPSYSPMITWT